MRLLFLLLFTFSTFFIFAENKKDSNTPTKTEKSTAKTEKTAEKKVEKKLNIIEEVKETIGENLSRTCAINYDRPYTLDTALIVGSPNGFDFRFWFPFNISMESIIGVDFNKNFLASLGVNHKYKSYENPVITLNIDYGTKFILGTQLDDDGRSLKLSFNFPLGITIPIRNSAISFSTYFAPGFTIKPLFDWDYSWGITFIYNFEIAKRERGSRKCLSGELGKLGGKYDALGGEFDKLGGEFDKLGKENEGLNLKNKALEAEKASLEFEKNSLESDKTRLESEKKTLESSLSSIESEKEKIEEQLKNTSSSEETEDLKKQLEEITKQKEQAEKEKERLQEEKESLNKDLEQNSKKTCELSGGTFKNGKCSCPTGRVAKNNKCVCAGANESWSDSSNKCTCIKGYSTKNGSCKKCNLTNYWGNCVSKCSNPEVPWKEKCICPNSKGYKRASNGTCVCKEGYKDYGDGCIKAGN